EHCGRCPLRASGVRVRLACPPTHSAPAPVRDLERRQCVLRPRAREPSLGLPPHPGRGVEAGLPVLPHGAGQDPAQPTHPPPPRRSQITWREFARKHAAQMLATAFFTVASPTGEWVAQQARNLAWKLQDGALKAKFLLRDRDCKFIASFDQVFGSEGVKVLRL